MARCVGRWLSVVVNGWVDIDARKKLTTQSTLFQGEYYRPLVTSPGVAVLVMKEDSSESAKAILMSVISAWPVLLLTVVIAWLAGIVMWALVRHKEPCTRFLNTSLVTLTRLLISLRIHGITQMNFHVLSTLVSSKVSGGRSLP